MIDVALAWLPRLAVAAALTIALAAAISAITGPVGAALALALYGHKARRARAVVEGFSAFFRAIPELVVLFFFYFGATQVGVDLGSVGSTVLAFALVGAAYDYQVFKGALGAIPLGQYEVGRALGMPAWAVYWKVILPQMLPLAKKGWITYAKADLDCLRDLGERDPLCDETGDRGHQRAVSLPRDRGRQRQRGRPPRARPPARSRRL